MPKSLFETPRLSFREFTMADFEAVYELNANPEVTRFTGDAGKVQSAEDAKRIISDIWVAEYQKYGYSRCAMVSKKDNRVIGFSGLKFLPEEGLPDLGYRMLPEFWGQGLGYEAALATLKFGVETLQLETIMALAMADNVGSNRILQKLKFNALGIEEYLGERVYRYEISNKEFFQRHG